MSEMLQQPDLSAWKLVLEDEAAGSQVFTITKDTTLIGRALTTDIPLDDARISRHHVRLTRRGEQLLVEDLNSVNGTLVNNQAITWPYLLKAGDIITVGPFNLRVEAPANYLPQSQLVTRAYTIPRAAPPPTGGRPWLLIGLAAGLLLLTLVGAVSVAWFLTRPAPLPPTAIPTAVALAGPTIVLNEVPDLEEPAILDRPQPIRVTATDPAGVSRLELWVNGRRLEEFNTPASQPANSLTAVWEWIPVALGEYSLEVRAYNRAGAVNLLPVASLTVVAPPATPTPRPTAAPVGIAESTSTALPDTATPAPAATSTVPPATPTPAGATFTVTAPGLNVRSGPGTGYSTLGLLQQGDVVPIVGQLDNGAGTWWQIRYSGSPDGLGWISGSSNFGQAGNTAVIPRVTAPVAVAATATRPPTPVVTETITPTQVISDSGVAYVRAPAGKTLLIASNRSFSNLPARLTLSGGKSVAGGRELDLVPGQDVEMVLEPDFYRALWSSSARDSFSRGADFTAGPDQVVVMWIKPEDGLTKTEFHSQLARGDAFPPLPVTATPEPVIPGYTAPPGKAILVVANRSVENHYGMVTLSGGTFGGGKEIKLDAGAQFALEIDPADDYRAVWTSPAVGGVNGGREFRVSAGEVILGWLLPERRQIFMQFPGQPPEQINN